MGLSFHIVDVFAEMKYQGNQLAVFKDCEEVSGDLMQKIARELNFSETTFITGEDARQRLFKVRIFTPVTELPFAGHPTLGTAFVIQQTILGSPVEEVTLDLKGGKIPVNFSYQFGAPQILWMKQQNPSFGKIHKAESFAHFLGLRPEDVDNRYPVQEVSTGVTFFIIPLMTGAALRRAKIDKPRFFSYVEKTEAKATFLFCSEPRDPSSHLEARMFGAYYGVDEDPATGSAGGCLAGYLARYRYFGGPKLDVRVEQGYEVGRPSLIYLRSMDKGQYIDVYVGGKVAMVAKGEFI